MSARSSKLMKNPLAVIPDTTTTLASARDSVAERRHRGSRDFLSTALDSRPPLSRTAPSRYEPPLSLPARLSPVACNHGRQLPKRTPVQARGPGGLWGTTIEVVG